MQNKKILVLSDQCIVSGTNFITGIFLAKILGADLFGVFAFSWLLLLIMMAFQFSFFIQPMQIFLPKLEPAKQNEYVGSMQYIFMFWVLIAGGIAATTVNLSNLDHINNGFIFATLFTVILALCQDYLRRIYIIKGAILSAVLHDGVVCILQLLSLLVIYFSTATPQFCLFAIGCSYLPSVITGFYKSEIQKFEISKTKSAFLKNWAHSKWLVATSTLQIFTGNYLLLLAPGFLGVAVLGSIRLAQNLIGILNVILQAFDNYVPVSAAKLFSVAANTSYKYLTKISLQTAGIMLGILLFIFVFAERIFSITGGASFQGNAYILQGFCFVYFFMFAGYPLRIVLRLQDRTHHIFIAYILASISNLFSAKFVLQNYGVTGLLVALAVIQCIMIIYFTLILLLNKRYHANYSLHIR